MIMLMVIISLLIAIATFYLMAYLIKTDHEGSKVTFGDMFDAYNVLVVGVVIPVFNVILFIIFIGIVLFKKFEDVKIL